VWSHRELLLLLLWLRSAHSHSKREVSQHTDEIYPLKFIFMRMISVLCACNVGDNAIADAAQQDSPPGCVPTPVFARSGMRFPFLGAPNKIEKSPLLCVFLDYLNIHASEREISYMRVDLLYV
jgi:hypothetical protein